MSDINRLIRQGRKSVFPQFFVERELPAEVLKEILENANWAPSHRQTEPWRFVVFRGAGKQQIADQFEARYRVAVPADKQDQRKIDKTRKKMSQADSVIAVVLHRDPEKRVPEWEEIAAVAMAVQNLWLSLDQYELGGYWSSPGILTSDYGLFPWTAENERCLGLFYLGYADCPDLPRKRGSIAEKLTWIEE